MGWKVEKESRMNIRKYYEKQTGKKIPKGFDIHHIDQNRDNNTIINLVALPKKLHANYHRFSHIPEKVPICKKLLSTFDHGHACNMFTAYELLSYAKCFEECKKWMDYRNYLLDDFPNIHNIIDYEVMQ